MDEDFLDGVIQSVLDRRRVPLVHLDGLQVVQVAAVSGIGLEMEGKRIYMKMIVKRRLFHSDRYVGKETLRI